MTEETANTNEQTSPGEFATIAGVLGYLEGAGWKITKSTLHRHKNEGKILPGREGKYSQDAVDKYARSFLKQATTGKKIGEAQDELQRKKLEMELKNLELKNRRDIFAFEREQGRYIPREQMEIELATRAGVLVAGLKHWVQSNAADWIAAVGGDNKKVGELINIMNTAVDEHVNTYASSREYEVIIEAEDDEARRLSGEAVIETEPPAEIKNEEGEQ